MIFVVTTLLVLALGIVIGYCRKIYLNRGFTKRNINNGDIEVEIPKFKIVEIEKFVSPNNYGKSISKYTANVWFVKKHGMGYEKIIFFDEIGKYNIGDKLTLSKQC
jgi:predicted transcriptional regulator